MDTRTYPDRLWYTYRKHVTTIKKNCGFKTGFKLRYNHTEPRKHEMLAYWHNMYYTYGSMTKAQIY